MRRPDLRFFAPLLALALLAGCASPAPEPVADVPTLHEALARGAVLDVTRSLSQGRIDIRLPLVEVAPSTTPLPVLDGRLFVQTDLQHALIVHELAVSLSDVRLPAQRLPPAGLAITDIHVLLADPALLETESLGEHELFASTRTDLLLTWSMTLPDGSTHRLADEVLEGARLDIHAFQDADGHVVARAELTLDEVHD